MGAERFIANTHDDEKYNDSDYETEESWTHHDPKLVPPISRQGILMGMIPSSVTLRLSLDPTTISSFRVTWGIVLESSNNILSFFGISEAIIQKAESRRLDIELRRRKSFYRIGHHHRYHKYTHHLNCSPKHLWVKGDGGPCLYNHWKRFNRDFIQSCWLRAPIWWSIKITKKNYEINSCICITAKAIFHFCWRIRLRNMKEILKRYFYFNLQK